MADRIDTDDLRRGTTLGRYVVLERLGAGGMGVVYAAYDPELDRRVALKLVRPGDAPDPEARSRLLREARALARVSHPNVVPVHDAGTFGDEVFLAMALIEGRTLRAWLAERPRSPRGILELFILAGRGLAAAHAAGVVHRDFKPENVLIGAKGEVEVTDFGQARPVEDGAEHVAPPARRDGAAPILTATPITEQGALIGTPAYMAPEQFLGRPADARSDQFSFCVALWEALHGERPFEGQTLEQLAFAVTMGQIRTVPRGSGVSASTRQALLRGLSPQPDQRFPSMEALLDALARDPVFHRRRRWIVAGIGSAAVAGAVGLVVAYSLYRAQLCSGGPSRLAGVWDEPRRAEVERALLATSAPFAQAAVSGVRRILDGYAGDWLADYRQACAATHLRGEQSEQLLDLRMRCLERRRTELASLVDALAHADLQTAEKSVSAASALRRPVVCDDLDALASIADPVDPGSRKAVEGVRARIAQAEALLTLAKFPRALEIARAAASEARAANHEPVLAEALYRQGDLEGRTGDLTHAEQTLGEAALVADRSRHDEARASVLTELIFYVGLRGGRFPEALRIADQAGAVVDRLGAQHDEQRAQLLNYRAAVLREKGEGEAAVKEHEHALAVRERASPGDDPKVARMLNNVGITYEYAGRLQDALTTHTRARGILERAMGAQHPDVAGSLTNAGTVLYRLGRFRESEEATRRALEIYRAVYGARSTLTAPALLNLGAILRREGQVDEAVTSTRAAAEIKAGAGPGSPALLVYLNELGSALEAQGEIVEARSQFQRSLDIGAKALGPTHSRVASALAGLGRCALASGNLAGAVDFHKRAVAAAEGASGNDPRELALHLTDLGRALVVGRRWDEARPLLERAVAIQERHPGDPTEDAETRFVLAQVRWERGDRPGSLQLADAALVRYRTADGADVRPARAMERWVSEHRGPSSEKRARQ